ncbi:MAG: sugar-binding domain-containing protein, partial [Candidatus Poribacteria bacterium]
MSHVAAATVALTCVACVMSMTPRAAAAALPDGVTAEWGLGGAHREATPTRERVSVNGLWEWRPAETAPPAGGATIDATEAEAWGHVKVPGPWPGSRGNYMWRHTQTHYPGAGWAEADMRSIDMAWYRREITIPTDWGGRRVTVAAEYVNSYAAVYVDGRHVGEIHFPGGEADITASVSPGSTHTLSLFVAAMPLHAEIASYSNSSEERRIRGTVALRGLCGDVWLVSSPASTRISGVAVTTSVARGEIMLDVEAIALSTDEAYQLSARISERARGVVEAYSAKTSPDADGRLSITHAWRPDKLWDTHTPENTYEVEVSLLNASGDVIDTWRPVRFGFREFVIDGPDFVLNCRRVHLFAVPLDNAQISAAAATYDGARETLTRLQSWGVNAVYTHNYGCQPGTHLGFNDILRAADDVGMLVGFS